MKQIMRFACLFVFSIVFISCAEKQSDSITGSPVFDIAGYNPIVIDFGETKTLVPDKLEVTFESLLQDSRCPHDVECFWEGMGQIRLRVVELPGDTHFVDLTIYGETTMSDYVRHTPVDTLGYRFTLMQLDPYPVIDEPVPDAEYTATLTIFPFTPNDAIDGEVQITDQSPVSIQVDDYFLDTAYIDSDILHLSLSYSGGCWVHDFALYMSPAAFLESYPAQANLYLRHEGHDDPCDAIIGWDLTFDLRPIAHLYELGYQDLDPIILNMYHYFNGQPGEKTRVVYHPEDTWWSSRCP